MIHCSFLLISGGDCCALTPWNPYPLATLALEIVIRTILNLAAAAAQHRRAADISGTGSWRAGKDSIPYVETNYSNSLSFLLLHGIARNTAPSPPVFCCGVLASYSVAGPCPCCSQFLPYHLMWLHVVMKDGRHRNKYEIKRTVDQQSTNTPTA